MFEFLLTSNARACVVACAIAPASSRESVTSLPNTASITITIVSVNQAPVASTVSATTSEDSPVEIQLTATDVDEDDLTYSVVSAPEHGTVSISGSTATYTPEANYNGSDSFTFKVNDGTVDSEAATVSLAIVAFNDPPVATPQTDVAATEQNAVTITLAGLDPDLKLQQFLKL